jgi:fumarylacetoacetate (FAA) hydrolase
VDGLRRFLEGGSRVKLASLRSGRDGALLVVDRKLEWAVHVGEIAPTMQAALEDWDRRGPVLQEAYRALARGAAKGAFRLDPAALTAPLPRAFQFVDGSAYLAHVERVRKARGAQMPPSFLHDPLMYQAVCDGFMAAHDPVVAISEEHGIDFESEVGVLTDDVPMGITAAEAAEHVKLLVLINDVSLRNLIPAELDKGFGFLVGKPRSALSPVAVTPDELGDDWRDGKLHRSLRTHLNDELFGEPDCGEDMQFSFHELIVHAARTRPLGAGTLVGSGTIANRDESRGSSCIAERRILEKLRGGAPKTPFMRFGDRVRIEMVDDGGHTIFGAIDQRVERYGAS